ncbi:MAG TPA: hypothetical protein VFT74_05065, partial [Isosphaeraceae bacterium]|nr:hypothetical protein [Isosphaeraceae bacterium]
MSRLRGVALGLMLAGLGAPRGHASGWTLEIEGGQASSGSNLVVAEVPAGLETGRYVARDTKSGESLDLVVFEDGKTHKLAFLEEGRTSKEKQTFSLQKQESERIKGGITIEPKDGGGADVETN